jgi:hypothetical protein
MTLSPIDVPPVTTEHSAQILGDAFPTTSETGTVESVLTLFQQAAESLGTSNTAEVMFALIEANATGHTPTELIGEFTADQRAAFDRALRQLNMGQGASVMAQDILNTKVQLNGVVTTFEAAVQELIASYGATGPASPRSQAEFQQKYRELLDKAKEAAKRIGDNHRSTQDSLVSGVRKGAVPQIPSTMAPTSSSNPTVPGMPDNALGSMLQNVAGVMSKPSNLPMPNISQAIQPAAQSAQSAISELMNKLPGKTVPISDDALSKLTTNAGLVNQTSSLSNPRSHGAPGPDSRFGSPAPGMRAPLSGAHGGENSRHLAHPSGDAQPAADEAPTEVTATTPTAPATTSGPSESVPAVTLSSGQSATGTDSLHAPGTHLSSGEAATATSPLAPTGAGMPHPATVEPSGAMAPMMGPMMGAAAGAGGENGRPSSPQHSGEKPKWVAYSPQGRDNSAELRDFGANFKGLEHATDQQVIAASIAAGLLRAHRRKGIFTGVAVGVRGSEAPVFATSDGLGFLPPEIRADGYLRPLVTAVPDDFMLRWLGCDQPWRPLLEAAGLGMVGPFDAVVATDPAAGTHGVLVLTAEEVDAVNITGGSAQRWELDAIDVGDVDDVVAYLCQVWGRPVQAPVELEFRVADARWAGEQRGPAVYAEAWARYLLSAAVVDILSGRIDDARYMLRNALRVPEPVGSYR